MGKRNLHTALFLVFLLLTQAGQAQEGLSGALLKQKERFDDKSRASIREVPSTELSVNNTELPGTKSSTMNLEGHLKGKKTEQEKELEPHYWNLNIALMRQKKGLDNFSEVLTAYSDLVEKACMSTLQSKLEYNGQEKSTACQEVLDQFGAIAPEAPSLVCARDGIDSQTCSEAHQALEVETARPVATSTSSEAKKLFGESSEDIEERLKQKEKKLFEFGSPEVFQSLPEKEREEKLMSIHKILVRLLEIGCKGSVYGVAKKKPMPKEKEKGQFDFLRRQNLEAQAQTQPQKTSFANRGTKPSPKTSASSNSAPLEDEPSPFFAQESENSDKKVARKIEEDETLVRYLTPQCQSQISLAFRWDSNFYAAICAQYGEYSPNCIQAKRTYRKAYQLKNLRKNPRSVRSYGPQGGSREPEKLFQTF